MHVDLYISPPGVVLLLAILAVWFFKLDLHAANAWRRWRERRRLAREDTDRYGP